MKQQNNKSKNPESFNDEIQHPSGRGSGEMIEAALNFWFSNQEHIRSPFPEYIHDTLRTQTLDKFFDWTSNISERAKKEINDEIIAEKFEEILFETAAAIVQTEDEKLTILYPFMPRIGDVTKAKDLPEGEGKSEVVGRMHARRGDYSFMNIKFKTIDTGKEWETEFELPE